MYQTMTYLEIITVIRNILFCIPSLTSATKFDYWWIMGFDFSENPEIHIDQQCS